MLLFLRGQNNKYNYNVAINNKVTIVCTKNTANDHNYNVYKKGDLHIASTNDMLNKILLDLKQMGGINASSIASRDGLLVVSDMDSESHAETFAAMSATMLGAAENATTELGKGIPDRVIVESDHGKLVAMGAGPKALLVILTEPDAGLGLILVELEKSVEKIKKIM